MLKINRLISKLRNPLISGLLFVIANIISFVQQLQEPFFFMFGVLGNFFLTFCFSFLLMVTFIDLDRIFKKNFFKYLGYAGVVIYFYLYTKWIFTVHYSFVIGYFILSFGVYEALRFGLRKKRLSQKDFFY